MLRILLVFHRYLAVAVGLLMALWCLSGFVMMYQPYPALGADEYRAGLPPLQLGDCCRTDFLPADGQPAGAFRTEMLGARPVLRQPGAAPVDLSSGQPIGALSQTELQRVAAEHASRRGLAGEPRWLGEVELDQWTLQSAQRNRPVHHFAVGDAAGTELYVNGSTGEVFQDTTRRERVLTWFGAIPHWLYPTTLRRNGPLWSQIVIWTSVIGCFLAATGLYVGIARLRRQSDGKLASPLRGWWHWHHIAGLIFGVLALTWVYSGLLTMNPWGWLEGGETGARLRPQLLGAPATGELRTFLEAAPARLAPGEFTQLRAAPFGGSLFVLAQRADGTSVRLGADARPEALTASDVQRVFAGLDTGVESLELLVTEDAYHYSHKGDAPLPVWRAVLADADRTRVYLDPASGDLRVVDRAAMKTRWLARGLHGLDLRGLRQRPLWDIVTLLLLAGVTVLCITGSWMAIQRVRRDFSRN
jgi:uncharacterized iron-regulated membrane protein